MNTHIDTLTELHEHIISSNTILGDTLRLCISTFVGNFAANNHKSHQEEYSKRVLWCLDRGYEYVEVDLSEEGLTRGFDVREKDGFARVVEAISGTVWSSAVMKGRGGSDGCENSSKIVKEKRDGGTMANNNHNDIHGQEQPRADPCFTVVSHDGGWCKEEIMQSAPSPTFTEKAAKNQMNTSCANDNEDSVLENIEQIMEEAKRIRMYSKIGSLSDEERKNRAGNAAEILLGLLDQMGGFHDEDDDEGDEDEDEDVVDDDDH
jgi:hypothetical protein